VSPKDIIHNPKGRPETKRQPNEDQKKDFKCAVEDTPGLKGAWKAGLQALRPEDKPHIFVENTSTSRLRGSVDIDTALRKAYPNANRWDFAIGYQHTNRKEECVYWVELHTASDSQVKVVLAKHAWLLQWLAGDGKLLNAFERNFVWLSSGSTSFTPGSPQRKRLAQVGLLPRDRRLTQTGTNFRIMNERR